MPSRNKTDWIAIRGEYLLGESSYRALAEKFGVSLNTLEKRAQREGWAAERKQVGGIVAAELTAFVAQKQVESAETWHTEVMGLASMLLRRLEMQALTATQKVIVQTKEGPVAMELPWLNSPRDLKATIDAFGKLSDIARKWLGLDKDASKESIKDLGHLFDEALALIEGRQEGT